MSKIKAENVLRLPNKPKERNMIYFEFRNPPILFEVKINARKKVASVLTYNIRRYFFLEKLVSNLIR